MTGRGRYSAAWAGALALHAIAVLLAGMFASGGKARPLWWIDMRGGGAPALATDDGALFPPEALIEPMSVVVVDEAWLPPHGEPPLPVDGTGEAADLGHRHPAPRARVDMPGARAAAAGSDERAGDRAWTGRADDEDYRAQVWSDARRYQLARERDDGERARRSDESIARREAHGFDDRDRRARRRARTGQAGKAPRQARGDEALGFEGVLDRVDEVDSNERLPVAEPAPSRVTGALTNERAAALVDRGERATETAVDGPTVDNTDSIASSDERDPKPFEMTRSAAGGEGRVPGVAATAAHRGQGGVTRRPLGSAASRAPADRGPQDLAVQAWRTDPYFRTLYSRVDALVTYPRELARSLEQGEVVVGFTLYADGRIGPVRVEKSSGYVQFDRQVKAAVTRAAPFGRVPPDLLDGRTTIRVRAPYAFRNPWIR